MIWPFEHVTQTLSRNDVYFRRRGVGTLRPDDRQAGGLGRRPISCPEEAALLFATVQCETPPSPESCWSYWILFEGPQHFSTALVVVSIDPQERNRN